MLEHFDYDVFLSHNSADKPRLRQLAHRLKEAGVRVWFDEWAIKAGDIIALKLDEGLERSRVLLLCISKSALASGWVALERSSAVHRDPANAGHRFIPLLLDDCDLPDTLRRYKNLDYRRESEEEFAEVLLICRVGTTVVPTKQSLEVMRLTKKKPKREIQPQKHKPIGVLEHSLVVPGDSLSIAISPDGTWFVSVWLEDKIGIWDMGTGQRRATLDGHTGAISSVAITPDGKRILSGSADRTIRIWDAKSGEELAQMLGHEDSIWSLIAMRDNIRAFSGGFDKKLRLWNLNSLSCIRNIEWGASSELELFCSTASQAGGRAITGHRDGGIRVWSLETGACLATLKGHRSVVMSVQITSDERFAFSGSSDGTIKVWNLATKTCVGTLEGHSFVASIDISTNGCWLASAGLSDMRLRLWDWNTGACLQVIKMPIHPTVVVFSPDGMRLIVKGGVDGEEQIIVYRLTGTQPKPATEITRHYANAKVVLLGEGTVGKTSLAHRLIEDEYVIKDRTHGMNVWRLDLPLVPHATLEREVLLWDLAGQEDYRLIHQLFLEQTALALMLVNPQKDDPFLEVGEWLKALKATGAHEAKRLLIFSQIDVGGMKLGDNKIARFCEQYGFTAWLATSAKTGENCSDQGSISQPSKLKQLIADSIAWDRLPWTSTPRLLAELKNAVMALRDDSDIRLLRFSELAQRLEQALPGEKFDEADMRTAVTLLANHGLVRMLKFGDLVLLRPELINGYAGAVIRAARAHIDEIGCVLEADIYQPEFDFTGITRLKHRPDEELLLRALVQIFLDHALCIAEATPQGRHLVFPSQYRREKDTPKHPDIFVSYTFSGEWQSIWTTLVVRLWYSQEFAHRELWRNAAEFESSKQNTLGMLIKKDGDGVATISLYFDQAVPDELKVIFIEYVHRHLARYAGDVVRDRRYLCQACTKPVTDLDAVRRRLAAQKDFIYCQECDEKVPLIDFIEQRLKSDPVVQKILAMEANTTRALDGQALEQILIGHMMAIAGEANQIFRPVMMFDHGIDGEVEFKDDDGNASGKRIYIQLKSGNSYLRKRKGDGSEVFDVSNERHLEYWISQPVDVYLVIRQTDEMTRQQVIRWMNVTRYLKARSDKSSRQIVFKGEKLDMEAVWKLRDAFFPAAKTRQS